MTNFLWLRRRSRNRAGKKDASVPDMELTIPTHFRCPISLDLMKDPVSLSTGITYDRESIEKWLDSGNATCPVTNQVLRNFDQIPNHAIRKMIQEWCVDNKSRGVERIPTPRVPITPHDVSDILSKILAATKAGDEAKCRELVTKVKDSARESERNRRCLASNKEIGAAMAGVFASFSETGLLKEVLSVLTWSFHAGEELKSAVCLRRMVGFLSGEDLTTRKDAVLVLKGLVSADPKCVEGMMEIEGVEEALFGVVKLPICPKATRTCLVIMHEMMMLRCERSREMTVRLVRMGLVGLVLDVLVEGGKSSCEKALGVLNIMCESREGKESACSNALTVPLVVKKILRVSGLGTDFAIFILWKLAAVGPGNESVLAEAVQLGAFQKLLVVLQVGCGGVTKEKATELLRLMNMFRNKLDCFDSSMGFKQLKRP